MAEPEHVVETRRYWDEQAPSYAEAGARLWRSDPAWGCWGIDNAEIPLLPDDLSGLDAVELGCGTAYGSAWMVRRGARVVAVDVSPAQLETARGLRAEHGLAMELLLASAEETGLPSGAFDFALSEYGAALWCDPGAWLREAARLLRPGGRLNLLSLHPLVQVCSPADGSMPITERLEQPWYRSERFDWRDADDEPGGIEFVPSPGSWFHHARSAGFRVADYREVGPPAPDQPSPSFVTTDWARQWPAEQALWLVRE